MEENRKLRHGAKGGDKGCDRSIRQRRQKETEAGDRGPNHDFKDIHGQRFIVVSIS